MNNTIIAMPNEMMSPRKLYNDRGSFIFVVEYNLNSPPMIPMPITNHRIDYTYLKPIS